MQGSKLGVWIAHGEGKVKFPDGDRMAPIVANGQARGGIEKNVSTEFGSTILSGRG